MKRLISLDGIATRDCVSEARRNAPPRSDEDGLTSSF
jgi:hypothetical protein